MSIIMRSRFMRPTTSLPILLVSATILWAGPVIALDGRATQSPQPVQPASPAQPAQSPAAQTPAPAPSPTPPPAAAQAERKRTSQLLNVKLDTTITDQSGSSAPVTKTLSVVVADGGGGSIRSQASVPVRRAMNPIVAPSSAREWVTEELPLNVDLNPEILEGGKIRVQLVLNYRTVTEAATATGESEPPRTSRVTETVRLILDSGKSMTVSQSADAASDRKVTVELKATILR